MAVFIHDQLQAIGGALCDTSDGLTGSEIQHLLASSKMVDPGPITRRICIFNAFTDSYPDLFIVGRFYRSILSAQGFLFGTFEVPGFEVLEVEVRG